MEAVKCFNKELTSLYESKPPISRAKMTQLTKSAIKAIKLYKHVVQSVEKFIQKCKPEYKVPGLYVIDSIVRQSRHQFGTERDVFAPRFAKNLTNTFQNLYRCPSDDKSRIVRVLNLWQKNNVFGSEIIQPLLDMAAGIPHPAAASSGPSAQQQAAAITPATPNSPATPQQAAPPAAADHWGVTQQMPNADAIAAVAQLLQSSQSQQPPQLLQSLQQKQQLPLAPTLDANLVAQVQALTAQLTAAAAVGSTKTGVQQNASQNAKLLDRFDYDDEPEATEEKPEQLPLAVLKHFSMRVGNQTFSLYMEEFRQRYLEQQEEHFQQQIQQRMGGVEHHQQMFMPPQGVPPPFGQYGQPFMPPPVPQPDYPPPTEQQNVYLSWNRIGCKVVFPPTSTSVLQFLKVDGAALCARRSPRRFRSRSRSGSRKRKYRRRSRSRSRDRRRRASRSLSRERHEREHEREREKKGFPPMRPNALSVCSTTLWLGQIDKRTNQQDILNLFEEYGQIESINMIPPRGCAYVCMVQRPDAVRALQKLNKGKMNSKSIKIAWAPNKGVKSEYKQYWDVETGVTYIPWERVKREHLNLFTDGGVIDGETMCSDWEDKPKVTEEEGDKKPHGDKSPDFKPATPTQAEPMQTPKPLATLLPQVPVSQGMSMPPVRMVQPPPSFAHTMPPFNPAIPPPPFLRAHFNQNTPPPEFVPGFLTAGAVPPPTGVPPVQP
uniref:SR-related CTD associated factor 8 n=1 Tax=Petromyzon marinus TaxID=7757 RepID=S4RNS5_PETMA